MPFQPGRQESKDERTDRAAWEIIREEDQERQTKTERLKAARLEREKLKDDGAN